LALENKQTSSYAWSGIICSAVQLIGSLFMGPRVYVKVVGFRDDERHALNTLFKLSVGQPISYTLWTPEAPVAPALALIDLESYEGDIELASPNLNTDLKLICVGSNAPVPATQVFQRPLDWPEIVEAMDRLFGSTKQPQADPTAFDQTVRVELAPIPVPGLKVALLVSPSREDRMYLRARLSLAGITDVDEAEIGSGALDAAKERHFDLVIVGLDVPDMDGWSLIQNLVMLEPAIGGVFVISTDTSWHMREYAEQQGCRGLIEKPYDPLQIVEILQKI
jgi:CheY-like chemotaxis protein